jgi:hypothetical protein
MLQTELLIGEILGGTMNDSSRVLSGVAAES